MNEKNFHLTKQRVILHVTTTWLIPETTDLITKQIKETKSFNSCSDSLAPFLHLNQLILNANVSYNKGKDIRPFKQQQTEFSYPYSLTDDSIPICTFLK